ncbi:type VI secretion system Vgr family protein [Paraburkholderia bryophila]|uniref:Type VI secretion system secreted protein VgrG n=1 Tax=Paraburkholderia bryophila TaxID=420952 RepID=A0A329C174_9BURK|nr:type VI secretion system Vgr family protein [Paraburkholderia bryophila]RAS27797.1 type VI secretion system secreted protein VgrG [Paraburkholderia bryophila]
MGAQDYISTITGTLSQSDRLLKLDTPLGANTLVPQFVVGRSRIGCHFEFTVDVVSTSGSIELKKLIAQPVTLWIQQADKSYLPHNGYVHTARRLGSNSGLTSYQLGFASWMHFLKFRRDQCIWQDKSVDDIVADVFNKHPQAQGLFQFALSKPLPSRSYCRQDEDDWNFVHRLLESEGLYGFWQQAQDGKSHTLVITDRLQTFDAMSSKTVAFYRAGTRSEADALTQWSGTRTLQSTALTTRTFDYKNPATRFNPKGTNVPTMPNQGALPDQTEVYEYTGAYTYPKQDRGDQLSRIRMEEWESRAKRFHGLGGVRGIDAGRRFILSGHPDHDQDQANQKEFAVIEAAWVIANNLPVRDQGAAFPHSLQRELEEVRARHGGNAFKVSHADGSEGFFLTEIETQRTSVPYRSPLEHRKPQTHLESAIVVGPQGEEVYTDDLNRIKVQFIWDRLNGGDERASCWVRVAQSDAGNGYGGVHMPRVGEEVLIDHVSGDCDRPVVISRMYNGATKPQWHSNGLLSGYRSKEYGGNGFNQLVMDDATGQNRVHLYSSSYNSHLHLGYLIQHSANARSGFLGSGFDLKSDAYGAIRAGQGMYISTHPTSVGQPLSAQPASEQLINAESVIEAVSEASVAGQAESMRTGQEALKNFTNATQRSVTGSDSTGGRTAGGGTGSANGFSTPIMLMASPSGIALSTPQSTHIGADQHINVISGQDTYLATGKSLVLSVVEKISLFVQKAGIKMFASSGKVDIQAQNDEMSLSALKNLTIRSTNAQMALSAAQDVKLSSIESQITIAAKQGITLMSGGAYVKIANGNIEFGCPGGITLKSGNFHWEGPAQLSDSEQLWPGQIPANFSTKVFLDKQLQERIGMTDAIPYQFVSDSGAVIAKGIVDDSGATQRVFHTNTEALSVLLGEKGDWRKTEHSDDDKCGCGADHAAEASPDFAQLVNQRRDETDDIESTEDGKSLQSSIGTNSAPQVNAETSEFQRSLIEHLVFNEPAIKQAILDGED